MTEKFVRTGPTIQHYIGEELRATIHVDHFEEYCASAGLDFTAVTVEE